MMSIRYIRNRRVLAFFIVLMTTSVASTFWYNQQAVAGVCPDGWWRSADRAVLELCGDEKAKRTDAEKEEELKRKLAEPYYQTIPGSHPVVVLPQPEDTKVIEEIAIDNPDPYQRQARPVNLIGATSLWQAGSVPNAAYTSWEELYVVSHAGNGARYDQRGAPGYWVNNENPTLSIYVEDGDAYQRGKYVFSWVCPKSVGSINITKIVAGSGSARGIGADGTKFAGLNYKVYFTTSAGPTGYFDMATQTWTFD